MNVRKASSDWDIEQIKKICDTKGLHHPDFQYCLVCEDDAGNITGFANTVTTPTIDVFVADNPLVARKLYDTLVGGALATGQRALQFYSKRDGVVALYNHLGFEIIGHDYTIARKDL